MQVSIGILALALAYHFGATGARAQSGARLIGSFLVGGFEPPYAVGVDDSGRLWATPPPYTSWHVAQQLSGTPTAFVPTEGGPTGQVGFVSMANGDIYLVTTTDGAQLSAGLLGSNVFSGPTPAQSTSFGALKARYR
jgi:hypothetical protein